MELKELKKLKERLYLVSQDTIPEFIDRTEDGEFIIRQDFPNLQRDETGILTSVNGKELSLSDLNEKGGLVSKEIKQELGYFFNIECQITFRISKGKIKAYYYSEDDFEYHFDIDVNNNMSDKEIKHELIRGFSNKFGWVELFDYDSEKIKEVDTKFWAVFYYKGERKLIEVGRKVFEQHVKSNEENSNAGEDNCDEDTPEYYNLVEMCIDIASKNFEGLDKKGVFAEFYQLNKYSIIECAFMSVRIM